MREVERNAENARAHKLANNLENAKRERALKALAAYPDHARKLASLGLPVAAPDGLGEAFELRRLLVTAKNRIADELPPIRRCSTTAERLS
jgi:hypothetical protein